MLEMSVFNLVTFEEALLTVKNALIFVSSILLHWNYVAILCTLNNLVNAFASLMRANKPETVSIVSI